VPQEIALYPALAVEENLRLFGLLHGVDRRDLPQRVGWALEWTELSERAEDAVQNLSGGMKRRLNIACAVLHEPRVVVLDEPTVGVDPHARQRIWEMLAELRITGVSLIHSSHQLHEIEATCDRFLIMERGSIIAQGRLDQLVEGVAGSGRLLRVTFSDSPKRMPVDPAFRVDGNAVHGTVHDVATQLLRLLQIGEQQGLEILDIQLDAPSLEEVFAHMTRQELSN
jgi:ABC-2 type transport system ATP-binding protein